MNIPFSPELIHIYGPFGIQLYGLFIILGIIISITALKHNKRFTALHAEKSYLNILLVCVIAGCIGGRIMDIFANPYLYQHWYDWFAVWQGGFSILGSIIGVMCIAPLYLKALHIPILPAFDLAAIYMPLLQSIGRLGCFTAGCCYGTVTHNFLSIVYTNPYSLAPHNIPLHPTQLYSSLLLFSIFLFMYFIGQRICKKDGELFLLYLFLTSSERFFIDFLRADRIMINDVLSFHQITALIFCTIILGKQCFILYKRYRV
jgi:phosphatidylglycerol:prolipoprotein diacylglycerol transferase